MEPLSERDITLQEVKCMMEEDEHIPIFDKDNWSISNIESEKIINKKQPIVEQIEQELKYSKDNFFKVQVTQIQTKKKLLPIKSNKMQKDNFTILQKNPNAILKQGYLEKKTDSIIFKWNTRYMVLTSNKLLSFQNQNKYKVIACVNLRILPVSLTVQKLKIIFNFENQCENLILKAQTQKNLNEWKYWLKLVIDYHSKQNKLLLKTINKPLYESKDTLTQEQFLRYAETGDILLFQTNHTGAKIQRFFTNSDYDHVAMIIRFHRDELLVFECNPIDGVTIYEWKMFIKYFNLYQQVTIRKLHSLIKSDLNNIFLHFAKKNVGKKYTISPLKLLINESDFDWQSVKQQRGYFCSELIAKAYKSAGLLSQKKSSAKYWPVDFSDKGDMKLLKEAYLGSQQVIILNKHMKKIL